MTSRNRRLILGVMLATLMAGLPRAGVPASAASAPAERAEARGEWLRVGPNRYARIDWEEIASVDVVGGINGARPTVIHLNVVSGTRLRRLVTIDNPETIAAVRRRLAADAEDWVFLGRPPHIPLQPLTQTYVQLQQVSFVDHFDPTPVAGDEVVGLYAAGRRATKVYLGRAYRPEEIRKIGRSFGTASD